MDNRKNYIQSKSPRSQNNLPENNYLNNRGKNSQDLQFDINKTPSLICKRINYRGDPVTINGEVVSNKIILSCRPKHYDVPGAYLQNPANNKDDQLPNNAFQRLGAPVNTINKIDSQNEVSNYPYSNIRNPTLARNDFLDARHLGGGETVTSIENQGEKYEVQYRTMQCKRYERNFRAFLWVLFIINILLILIGISLLFLALLHIIFHNYIDTVIAQTGFVTWVWITLVLSLLIIIVGIYGVFASIIRTRTILITYCILAAILALIILIFLLLFWIFISNLKEVEHNSMKKTFHVYRCQNLEHRSWDVLQSNYMCCGVDYPTDWKYIPPSCCNIESNLQKVSCIGHFIKEDQAFKGGCRIRLEKYFSTMFMLITCLLILAFILLLLGILAAFRLMKMYKIILLCRDMYLITS